MEKLISVLIVDDEAELRRSLIRIIQSNLPRHHFSFMEAGNGLSAIEQLDNNEFDLVLMDVKMPEMDGLEALQRIKIKDPATFVVIMTAHSNLADAITAIREGAYDYIEKPVSAQRLTEIVTKCLEAREMVSELAMAHPIFDDDIETEFIGHSLKMRQVFDLIAKLCKVETTVLIRGENGTGKELVAKAIHFNSPRKSGPFVAVNCGAIPETLMESEFFGHEKGAFTGASERKIGKFQFANNGTLFLDEIGELKPEMQVKLLRILQEKKFMPVGGNREVKTNARIIAATNQNLEKMIQTGGFREDLFYRLNVMPIFLPPLRERSDDIPALVQIFIRKFAKSQPLSRITGITPEALQLLTGYQWPGNIRELENAIERAFIVESGVLITVASLPENLRQLQAAQVSSPEGSLAMATMSNGAATSGTLNYETFKEQSEKDFIVSALKANRGRINQTVAHANIPKNTLLRKIRKYGINVKEFTDPGKM
ncbi:MAG: sigma-54-dependent Fis family transcriptional regulator [Bdellovibrio sp.]|nr:MAG: sigma-54-dependent Fis family transcriptional regulator [Bdellovibrio sp.]